MRVSYFKGAYDSTEDKSMDIFTVLKEIKSEKYKSLIAEVRLITNPEERNKKKQNSLPMVTFSGTFSSRSKSALKKASGLAMMDFDKVEDLEALKTQIEADKFTFSSFVSPSGNGLKVLVKIPPVNSDEVYKEYYHELQKHFNQYAETDASTKDISRGTFVSIDSELYLNADSVIFTDKFVPPVKEKREIPNIPLTEQDEIAERLEKWFKKNYSTTTNRNCNLHSFARQFNAFGVDKSICQDYLLRYEQPDFKQKEILALIDSAYKYSAEWNTSAFEDSKKVERVRMQVIAGTQVDDIEGVSSSALKAEIKKHQEKLQEDEFWFYTENGAIRMATFRFLKYLENNMVSKYYPNENSGYLYIKKDDNFIKEFDENRIKDFTLSDLRKRGQIDAFELCANNNNTFSRGFLSMLSTSDIRIQRDTKTESYIYYQNTAVRTTKDTVDLIPYSDIEGLVWENQVIKRDFEPAPESEGEFKTFLWKISGEDKQRYYSFKSVIGYLLHSYQNEGKPKVIIFNDEMISDVPNGGSGKGLIHKALGHIKRLSTINGKGFDPTKSFAYQTVSTDTQVLLFDDIDKNFKFENLFSVITEGLIIEKKGKDAIKIPFAESPKISITTNYTVQGEGSSHNRRVFEVEMSAYFNDKHTPEDEFGHLLFSDWDEDEWKRFDNFMTRCIQFYLNEGLVSYETVNLDEKKLINDTNQDFIDFMDSKEFLTPEKRWYKTELKDAFVAEYEDYRFKSWFSTTKFNKWVKKYCEVRKLHITEGKTNGNKYITIEACPF